MDVVGGSVDILVVVLIVVVVGSKFLIYKI